MLFLVIFYIIHNPSDDNIKKLFLCLSDYNPKIKRNTLKIFLKLIPYQPKLITQLQYFIFTILSSISSKTQNYSHNEIDNLKDLAIIIDKAPFMLTGQIAIILDCLLFQLKDLALKKVELVIEILFCMKNLLKLDASIAQLFFDKISFRLLEILETNNSCFYRILFATLTTLLSVTGYQVVLLFRYDFFQLSFEILQRPLGFETKSEIMKFLGSIGAFDFKFMRKINKLRQTNKIDKYSEISEIITLYKKMDLKMLFFENNFKMSQNIRTKEDALVTKYENFLKGVSRLEKPTQFMNSLNEEKEIFEDEKLNTPLMNKTKTKNQILSISNINENNLEPNISSFESLLRLSTNITIELLFEFLDSDDFNIEIKLQVLKVLKQIVIHLQKLVYLFHGVLFLNMIKFFFKFKNKKLQKKMLKVISLFVKSSEDSFSKDSNNVKYLLNLIQENIYEVSLQSDLLNILKILLKDFGNLLQHRFKELLYIILNILFQTNSDTIINIIFDILSDFLPQDYFEIIIPLFCSFLGKPNLKLIKIKGILRYFETQFNKKK